jgi:hypothetical protein
VFLLVLGVISCAVGVSAASKLFRETLDSPRWLIGALALLAFLAGGTAIALAFRLRR